MGFTSHRSPTDLGDSGPPPPGASCEGSGKRLTERLGLRMFARGLWIPHLGQRHSPFT